MENSTLLKQERLTIAAQILDARQAGNFELEEKLESRQIRLPRMIAAVRDIEDKAALASLKAQEEALRPLEAAADIRMKEARAQFDYWKGEIEAAQKEWERLLYKSRIIDIRSARLERLLEVRAALLAAKNSGKPLRARDNFYDGLSIKDLKALNEELG